MQRVAIVYHMWPHYRRAVMEAMDRSTAIEYTFVGSGEPYQGILHVDPAAVRQFRRMPFRSYKDFWWQSDSIRFAACERFDAIIFLGNPNFLSTWIAAATAKARGLPVLFWEHGWRRREGALKARLRLAFFRLADRLLVYAPRAKRLGTEAGYPPGRIDVVWNSLDTDRADSFCRQIESGQLDDLRPGVFFTEPTLPVVICTARLTENCRFDLLLEAAGILKESGIAINILLVGDGPAGPALKHAAADMGLQIHFYGACYEERLLAQLIYHSAVTVSPGKVGLTAMHSLMYGTPVITHDNDDEQMPEVEAVLEGTTGARFRQNDAADLAIRIGEWIGAGVDRAQVRRDCRMEIAAHWNPRVQADVIESAVKKAIRMRRGHG